MKEDGAPPPSWISWPSKKNSLLMRAAHSQCRWGGCRTCPRSARCSRPLSTSLRVVVSLIDINEDFGSARPQRLSGSSSHLAKLKAVATTTSKRSAFIPCAMWPPGPACLARPLQLFRPAGHLTSGGASRVGDACRIRSSTSLSVTLPRGSMERRSSSSSMSR